MTPQATMSVDVMVTRPNTTAADWPPAATLARCIRSWNSGPSYNSSSTSVATSRISSMARRCTCSPSGMRSSPATAWLSADTISSTPSVTR